MDEVIGKRGMKGKHASQKSLKSILSKIGRKGKNASQLNDLARGVFLINDYANIESDISAAIDTLNANNIPYTTKDFFASPNAWGYRGFHVLFEIDGIGCEWQFATEDVWSIKTESDKIYEKWRDIKDPDKLSPDEYAKYTADFERSNDMWAGNQFYLPERINAESSSTRTALPSQKSDADIGEDGLDQTPSTSSSIPRSPIRTTRPSSNTPTPRTNSDSIAAPPNDISIIPQSSGESNETNSAGTIENAMGARLGNTGETEESKASSMRSTQCSTRWSVPHPALSATAQA